MNLGLYRSRHAAVAAAAVLLCLVWSLVGGFEFGSRDAANIAFLLVSGWLAVLLYLVLFLYAVRKAAHRSHVSPELRRRLPVAQLERAQSALAGLNNRIASRELLGKRAIQGASRTLLREHAVGHVLRVRVVPDAENGHRLTVLPKEPLGRLFHWLHSHLYYGLAAAAVVWFHGGGRVGSPMGLLLNALSGLVIATGIVGMVLWTFGPTWLTQRERELSIEKTFVLREHYARKVRDLAGDLAQKAVLSADAAQCFARGPQIDRRHLDALRAAAEQNEAVRDLLVLQAQRQNVEREWSRLGGLRWWMNAWRLVHVPSSIALLSLVVVHVVSVWYY